MVQVDLSNSPGARCQIGCVDGELLARPSTHRVRSIKGVSVRFGLEANPIVDMKLGNEPRGNNYMTKYAGYDLCLTFPRMV